MLNLLRITEQSPRFTCVGVHNAELASAGRILIPCSCANTHPYDVRGVRHPGRHENSRRFNEFFRVFAVRAAQNHCHALRAPLHVGNLLPVCRTGRLHTVAAAVSQLAAGGTIFLHPIKLEDSIFVCVAHDDFTQFSSGFKLFQFQTQRFVFMSQLSVFLFEGGNALLSGAVACENGTQ